MPVQRNALRTGRALFTPKERARTRLQYTVFRVMRGMLPSRFSRGANLTCCLELRMRYSICTHLRRTPTEHSLA